MEIFSSFLRHHFDERISTSFNNLSLFLIKIFIFSSQKPRVYYSRLFFSSAEEASGVNCWKFSIYVFFCRHSILKRYFSLVSMKGVFLKNGEILYNDKASNTSPEQNTRYEQKLMKSKIIRIKKTTRRRRKKLF